MARLPRPVLTGSDRSMEQYEAFRAHLESEGPSDLVVFGEIGLTGEIRPVPFGEERLLEAQKHGFARALIPAANAPRRAATALEILPVSRIGEALARAGLG